MADTANPEAAGALEMLHDDANFTSQGISFEL